MKNLTGKIVFSSGKLGDFDIFTLDLATNELCQLTTGEFVNDCPKWSPDGSQIVFVSDYDGEKEIWVMDQEGNHKTRLTNTDKWQNTPAWSPDGT